MPPQRFRSANELVEDQLGKHLSDLESCLEADCLTYVGPIAFGADDDIRDAVEGVENKKAKLVVILQTEGGFAEMSRRISDTFRHHYAAVDFLVPSHAMSAGTIIVMSGDEILMDYYSVLGPIDPQIEDRDGNLIPALGYLRRYEDLLKKAKRGKVSRAEMEVLLDFDQKQLYAFDQARNLSLALLEEWLCNYKWKNWTRTQTRGIKVTEIMKRKRAREIAKKLNDIDLWNSHGIGINMKQLTNVLKLQITDFGKNQNVNTSVRRYHRLLVDYMGKMSHISAVHTKEGYRSLITRR